VCPVYSASDPSHDSSYSHTHTILTIEIDYMD